jgi:hypothetical protein
VFEYVIFTMGHPLAVSGEGGGEVRRLADEVPL